MSWGKYADKKVAELARRARDGDDGARTELIELNMPLVTFIAKNEFPECNLSIDELRSAGNVALIKAVDRFDPDYGASFGTYAFRSIKRKMIAEVHGGHQVRISDRRLKNARDLLLLKAEMEQGRENEVGEEELAKKIGKSVKKVRQIMNDAMFCCVSMDEIKEDTGHELESEIKTEDPSLEAEKLFAVYKALAKLEDRERYIIVRIFGLDGEGGATYSTVGGELDLSSERIRQIRNEALEKLGNIIDPAGVGYEDLRNRDKRQ